MKLATHARAGPRRLGTERLRAHRSPGCGLVGRVETPVKTNGWRAWAQTGATMWRDLPSK